MWIRQFLPGVCWGGTVAFVLCGAPAAQCQTITGAITGTVTDSSGAAIPGATVTATNLGTSSATPTQTNQSGIYNLRFLPIGRYKVEVSAPGFDKQGTNDFTLEVAQEARIDIKMSVGSASQTVNVTSAAPILNAENAITGDTITAKTASEMPLQDATSLR